MSLFKYTAVSGQDILIAFDEQEKINSVKEATANEQKLVKAIQYLNKAADLCDNAKLNKNAEDITKVIEFIARRNLFANAQNNEDNGYDEELDDPYVTLNRRLQREHDKKLNEEEQQQDEFYKGRNKFYDETEFNREKIISDIIKYIKFRLNKDDFRDTDELKEGIFNQFVELNEHDDGELIDKLVSKILFDKALEDARDASIHEHAGAVVSVLDGDKPGTYRLSVGQVPAARSLANFVNGKEYK